jgi:hypothetical protein
MLATVAGMALTSRSQLAASPWQREIGARAAHNGGKPRWLIALPAAGIRAEDVAWRRVECAAGSSRNTRYSSTSRIDGAVGYPS